MSRFILVNKNQLIDIDKFDGISKSSSFKRIYFYYRFSNHYENEDFYYIEYNSVEEMDYWFNHIMKCLNVEPNAQMYSPEYPM